MSSVQTIPARRGAAAIVVDTWVFALPSTSIGTTSSRLEAPLYPTSSCSSSSQYSRAANRAAAAPEFMSMSHCRAKLLKLTPGVGDVLVSQKRAPLVKITEDTSPGVHDTLIAACDRWRYSELGVETYHESCTDNYWDTLAALAFDLGESEEGEILQGLQDRMGGRVPDPFNLFMNVPVSQEGEGARRDVGFDEPLGKAGDYVVLEALRDVVVIMSACPQDVLDINGKKPVDAHFEVLS